MQEYLSELATELGVSVLFLGGIFIWSAVWKLLALWKAARTKHVGWFIAIALLNTLGIVPILYYFFFSEMKPAKKEPKKKAKTTKKRKK